MPEPCSRSTRGETNPGIYGRVTWTFWPWLIVILGGEANNFGVALGSFVFVFLLKFIDEAKFTLQNVLPFDVNWLEYLAFGSVLIVILMLRPEGLLREKPSATLSESKISTILKRSSKSEPPGEREEEKQRGD